MFRFVAFINAISFISAVFYTWILIGTPVEQSNVNIRITRYCQFGNFALNMGLGPRLFHADPKPMDCGCFVEELHGQIDNVRLVKFAEVMRQLLIIGVERSMGRAERRLDGVNAQTDARPYLYYLVRANEMCGQK